MYNTWCNFVSICPNLAKKEVTVRKLKGNWSGHLLRRLVLGGLGKNAGHNLVPLYTKSKASLKMISSWDLERWNTNPNGKCTLIQELSILFEGWYK
jgi:hypothetical protein